MIILVVLLVGVVLVVGYLGVMSNYDDANEARHAIIHEAANERRVKFEEEQAAFLAATFGDIVGTPCRRGDDDAVVAPVDGGIRIASWKRADETFIEIPPGPRSLPTHLRGSLDFTPTSNFDVRFNEIVDVAARQNDVLETFSRTTQTPVAVAKKKSAIGRGLAGAAVLGPVGLVLGAASGATTTTRIQTVSTTVEDTRTKAGPPTLVLTLKATPYRVELIEFADMDDARSWARWIADQAVT